ncbi:MAG: DUF421 domain-containing protein [Bacilli bacterium]|jgi:uncharacterized membrane protein YcaP (DUF421 family)|nr:DUF421 domain-containing protein [Bacilli bacterium]
MEELFKVMIRTTFFYFFIVLLYRIMGKREIGQLGIIDLIVSILIAELVAISIENINDSVFLTVVPLILLVGLELLLAFVSIKSRTFRTIFGGKPSLIVCNGKINYQEMVKQRYTMDDLLLSLRQKSIKSIEEVEYAFLEPNGKLSIFKYNFLRMKSDYPMPLILDGELQQKALLHIRKNKYWLEKELRKKNLTIGEVFYAFYKGNKIYLVRQSDL